MIDKGCITAGGNQCHYLVLVLPSKWVGAINVNTGNEIARVSDLYV